MKIEAKDLRVGNWVISKLHKGLLTEIHTIMPNSVKLWANPLAVGYNLDEIEGIPLAPEILYKAGFELSDGEWHHNEWLPYLVERKLYNTDAVWYQVFNIADCNVAYLHELQNVFKATNLTDQELNIEL